MNYYNLSQIAVIIATIFIAFTYFLKSRKKILILFILYSSFYGMHYLLLNAMTGFLMNLVSIVRNIIFFRHEINNKENSKLFLLILFIIIIIFTIFSYKDYFSLISMFASMISTYSIWQKNHVLYKVLAVVVSICFIIYAIHINSLFAILTEVLLLLAEIIGLCLIKIQKNRTEESLCLKKKY